MTRKFVLSSRSGSRALRAEFKEHAEKLDDLLPAVWKQMQAATGERLGPGAAAVTEQFPEVKERRFGKQLLADKELAQELKDELGTSRYYEPIPNKATAEEAQRLVETRSVSENIRAIKDESSTLPPRRRRRPP